jgi:hypothetical protein
MWGSDLLREFSVLRAYDMSGLLEKIQDMNAQKPLVLSSFSEENKFA